ncbi:hypothetical protein Golomagni_05302 [Golovinomyces magnicellulatus]|nr:hypothetical protein Golomagni_05302 [Golovinomyces magnicellulatus]
MGRKPNALIIQYFERGAKLSDSSNRYQHTCKACGQKFPKGRIDSLTTHLAKKCPALSIQDKQNALLQLNDLPNIEGPPNNFHAEKSSLPLTVELPVMKSNWTALETLAEVSRQLEMSEKHDDRSVKKRKKVSNTKLPEQISGQLLELHEQYTLENPPVGYGQRIQCEKKASILKTDFHGCDITQLFSSEGSSEKSCEIPSQVINASIIEEAAAAVRFIPSMVDPQILANELNSQPNIQSNNSLDIHHKTCSPETTEQDLNENNPLLTDPLIHQSHGGQQLTWPIIDCSSVNNCNDSPSFECNSENTEFPVSMKCNRFVFNPSVMTTEFSAEYGNGQKSIKPKVRSRFSSSRRKEVQEVRKKGACIRCRMLKKPCSEGTPCNTCRNVESARLWKTPCIRTRVADELEMYSSGLHAVLAYHEINNMKSHCTFQPSTQQIELSHYPETSIYATFNSLEGHDVSSDGNIDPCLNESTGSNFLRILDYDNDDLASKLEIYSKRISNIFYEREPSPFMRTTLNFAKDLATAKKDCLLSRALELWSTVHILVDHEMSWKIIEGIDPRINAGQDFTIDQSCNTNVHRLICSQLSAVAESKASSLCKIVLNELERKLLQRSAAESFETFLVVLITFNCIEKTTWLFKSWEHESFKYRWPLDKTPRSIYSQGDKLADMLLMLLRMRNVPPKTYTRPEDGVLASDANPVAQEYYKKLNLTYVHVLSKQAGHVFDSANSRCYELRYCSRLLLPVT